MIADKLSVEPLLGTNSERHIYRLKGPLVLANVPAIQEVLRSPAVSMILDMTEVPYVDSAGLGILTNAYVSRQKNGYRLLLVGVNERVQSLFRLTKLDRLFEIFPTIESATGPVGIQVPSSAV